MNENFKENHIEEQTRNEISIYLIHVHVGTTAGLESEIDIRQLSSRNSICDRVYTYYIKQLHKKSWKYLLVVIKLDFSYKISLRFSFL